MCQIHDPPSIIKGTPSIDTKKCVNREQHQEQGAITHRIWRSGQRWTLALCYLRSTFPAGFHCQKCIGFFFSSQTGNTM